jgi:phospholipase/carboxylesterase
MSKTLPSVEVGPKHEPAGTALWLHGLGADGHDFEAIVPLLGLPDVRFVFPHAPQRPVTVNGGLVMRAWYDIVSLGDPGPRQEDEAGIRASALDIEALIRREGERGIPPSRIVLAGFSQGGALALHVGARYPEALLGIMALSAYEVLAGHPQESKANALTPMLFCHGLFDPLVPIQAGREAYQVHSRGARQAAWYEFKMAHQVIPDEIEVIGAWLKERFHGPSGREKP